VRGASATHDDREDVNLSTEPVSAECACEGGVFVAYALCGVREVVVFVAFPSLN
jgi:hypothetical protein